MFFSSLIVVLLSSSSVIASTVVQNQTRGGPSVVIKNGTVVGFTEGTVDVFKGIPFAAPPTGPRRLRAPAPLTTGFDTFMATASPTICPQLSVTPTQPAPTTPAAALSVIASVGPSAGLLVAQKAPQGEDCLRLNVVRPSNSTSKSKLPVLAWIYGGAFQLGSIEDNNATKLVQAGVALNEPFIYVAMNYRLAGLGFLGGKELSDEGSTNLALRDQRMALKWIQENIEAFGGDPSKVTLWGESAGSITALDQTVIDSGNNLYNGKPLFRGVILDSGSMWPALPVTHPKAQAVFDALAREAGCSNATSKPDCLRSVDIKTFMAAQNAVGAQPYRSYDTPFIPRPDPASSFFPVSPDEAVAQGRFAKVPVIIGDEEDEGTYFALAQSNISTTDQVAEYLHSYWPQSRLEDVKSYVSTYPANASAGSPFRTGQDYQIYPQYKRLAAILGDIEFTLVRRVYLDTVAKFVKSWSYLDSHHHSDVPVLGTFHGADLIEVYNGTFASPTIVNQVRTGFISFTRYGDPNAIMQKGKGNASLAWPQYDLVNRQLLHLNQDNVTLVKDDFRYAQYQALKSNLRTFRL